MPLILGRPFIVTGGALIDAKAGKVKLRLGQEEICFDMNKPMSFPDDNSDELDHYCNRLAYELCEDEMRNIVESQNSISEFNELYGSVNEQVLKPEDSKSCNAVKFVDPWGDTEEKNHEEGDFY